MHVPSRPIFGRMGFSARTGGIVRLTSFRYVGRYVAGKRWGLGLLSSVFPLRLSLRPASAGEGGASRGMRLGCAEIKE